MKFIYDVDLPEIVAILGSWGEPSYRATQVWHGLYQNLYSSPSQFSNLPKPLRQKMTAEWIIGGIEPVRYLDSKDGQTRKNFIQVT